MSIITSYMEWLYRLCGKSKRWKFIYTVNLWLYQHIKGGFLQVISCFRKDNKKSSPVKLFFYHGTRNFGDQLNLDVMNCYGFDFSVTDLSHANTVCIGSILDYALKTDTKTLTYRTPLHVLGAGFIIEQEYENEKFNRPVIIHALRGKLTLARAEAMLGAKLPDVVLGDPGLLVRRIFPDISTEKKYDVGIICHMKDVDSPFLKNIELSDRKIKMIDIFTPVKQFLEEMASCSLILSSSLHGLICADSFGIPNKGIILSGNVEGRGYKFQDYYSVFDDVSYAPVNLQREKISASDIENFRKSYKDQNHKISGICDRLEQVFKGYCATLENENAENIKEKKNDKS